MTIPILHATRAWRWTSDVGWSRVSAHRIVGAKKEPKHGPPNQTRGPCPCYRSIAARAWGLVGPGSLFSPRFQMLTCGGDDHDILLRVGRC